MEVDVLHNKNCLMGIPQDLPDNSIDLIPTDPPYGMGFMGKKWDKALPPIEIWQECLRVLKPGAFAFVMCIPRQDCLSRMIVSLEDAGFNVGFTSIYWAFASGFPKASNISKMVDKRLGVERKVIGKMKAPATPKIGTFNCSFDETKAVITAPAPPQAKALDGAYGGFQPKPSVEVILVAMKPLSEKTYVDQALANGKGVTWLGDGRIPYEKVEDQYHRQNKTGGTWLSGEKQKFVNRHSDNKGRFPANLLVSDDCLNDGSNHKSGGIGLSKDRGAPFGGGKPGISGNFYKDSGSFSRYFSLDAWWKNRITHLDKKPCAICGYIEEHGNYVDDDGVSYCDECLISGDYLDFPKLNLKILPKSAQKTFPYLIVPKASKREKNRGCEELYWEKDKYSFGYHQVDRKRYEWLGQEEEHIYKETGKHISLRAWGNIHTTVKPMSLFSYLITIGSREGDIILDPFLGSGTTLCAAKGLNRHYLGYETEKEYFDIALPRIAAIKQGELVDYQMELL